jgi:hypothetical protein
MACNHKFQQHLNLERLDFKPVTLIVGTFNPEWPESNLASWFYGRTHDQKGNVNNNFWDVLPRLYGEPSLLNASDIAWKAFCKRNEIAVTDLISGIADANRPEHDLVMGGYSDDKISKDFHQHHFTDIVALLQNNPTIKNIYLTRGAKPTFWSRIWRPVNQYCLQKDLHVDTLLTPSGYAFYQHGRYNNTNPQQIITNLNDFILMKWQEKWHKLENIG